MTRSLDLGCGERPRNPFSADEIFGIDIVGEESDFKKIADLAIEPIPFENEFFEYVTAYDFIEHIPRIIYAGKRMNPFIEIMNEIYRVMKPDGMFFSLTPAFPHAASFQDPTHVNIITEETFVKYFDDSNRWAASYGFTGSFKVLEQVWRGAHLATLLQKKPRPA